MQDEYQRSLIVDFEGIWVYLGGKKMCIGELWNATSWGEDVTQTLNNIESMSKDNYYIRKPAGCAYTIVPCSMLFYFPHAHLPLFFIAVAIVLTQNIYLHTPFVIHPNAIKKINRCIPRLIQWLVIMMI